MKRLQKLLVLMIAVLLICGSLPFVSVKAAVLTGKDSLKPSQDINLTATVTESKISIMQQPTWKSKRLGYIAKGTKVTLHKISDQNDGRWYQISATVNGKKVTGYSSSRYLTISVGSGFYAKTKGILLYRKTPSEFDFLTYDKKELSTSRNATVWVSKEVTVDSVKWFRISKRVDGKVLFGYVKADDLLIFGKKKPAPSTVKKPTKNARMYYLDGNHTFGYIDDNFNKVPVKSNVEFISVSNFCDGVARAKGKDGKYGLIDTNGNTVVPFIHESISEYNGKLFLASKDREAYAFYNKKNEQVSEAKYREVGSFVNGVAVVLDLDRNRGVVNAEGKEIIPCEYFTIAITGGVIQVTNEEQLCGLFDLSGKEIIPCMYKSIGMYSEGLAVVINKEGYFGYINTKGEEVIPCNFVLAKGFSNGLALVYNSEWMLGYINKDNEVVIPFIFTEAFPFSEGLAAVSLGEHKFTFINTSGERITPMWFNYTMDFHDGVAIVTPVGTSGSCVIDKTGKIIIPPKEIGYGNGFEYGYAVVGFGRDLTTSVVNKKGQMLVPLSHSVRIYENNLLEVRSRQMKSGCYDGNGKRIVPCVHHSVKIYNGNIASYDIEDRDEDDWKHYCCIYNIDGEKIELGTNSWYIFILDLDEPEDYVF